MTTSLRFPFRFSQPFRLAAWPIGIRPENSEVRVNGPDLIVTFGRWTLRTTIDNVVSSSITGPYSWPLVIGPPHLSLRDGGITFASNPDQGVCLRFRTPVPALLPIAGLAHPGATLTVDNPAALAELFDRASGGTSVSDLDGRLVEVQDDLWSMSASELRTHAKNLGIGGTSAMSKAALLAALSPVR